MPDTPSITIRKQFSYRGKTEEYHNKYHFSGTVPSDTAGWRALAAAIWASEKLIVSPAVTYVGYLGHEAGNEFAVANEDLTTTASTGRLGVGGGTGGTAPGDAAIWVRWATPDRTSRGKTIYLRKYFHGFSTTGDNMDSGLRNALIAHGGVMKDGSLPGGAKICGPQGAVAGAVGVSPFVSFRQLKRTGKRPSR